MPDDKKKEPSQLGMVGAGFEFVTSILFFVVAGYYADEYFQTSPFLLLIGFFLGFAYSFYALIKRAKENE
ncbi:AtpZ/AtpI family protein [Leptospira idonii]|uniref:AtpZ/AtpI family protein n=1 Tax=Leptospira idonii TaxID=1193500 RepID=A0A4V3JYD6_9LEPT|nr:AtpZ/AtpI family protein [Leptospira idonii]TGN20676.1 AtpZ/AtpI family protein [Leptospira idonii]